MTRIPLVNRLRRQKDESGLVVNYEQADLVDLKCLLAGSRSLVTGAGPNIGRSIAVELARHGSDVYTTDIERERLSAIERDLSQFDVKSASIVSDVSDAEEIDKLIDDLDSREIDIDVLVNNVAVGYLKSDSDGESIDAAFRRVFQTNVFGPMRLTEAIAERMIARGTGGSIIFISSIHQWSIHGQAPYSASKAAIGMIVKELALRLAEHKIRVNAIAPGWVAVDANGQPFRHDSIPLYQRSTPPSMIGRAVVHLASRYFSSFTTGSVVTIDGGLSLGNYLHS